MTERTAIEKVIEESRAYYCLSCAKCTSTCPVSQRERGFSPRLMVEAVVAGRNGSLMSDRRLWSCLSCRRCSAICPSGVRLSEFVRDVRGLAFVEGEAGHCSHGGTIRVWMRMMANPGLAQDRLGWLGEDLRTSEQSDTVYFSGCLPYYDVLFAKTGAQAVEIAQSAVRILNHLGIEPVVLGGERCCGHDLLWEGDLATFRRLAALNVEMLRATGASRVITTCPECTATLGVDYARYAGDLGMEVIHISQLLAQEAEFSGPPDGRRMTYQDPCRLGRYLGIYDEPRQVIAAMGGELAEMKHSGARSLCCGTSAWTNCGATSKRIQVDRLGEAKAAGADLLVTACAKCQIHFKCALNGADTGEALNIEIQDLTVLAAERLARS